MRWSSPSAKYQLPDGALGTGDKRPTKKKDAIKKWKWKKKRWKQNERRCGNENHLRRDDGTAVGWEAAGSAAVVAAGIVVVVVRTGGLHLRRIAPHRSADADADGTERTQRRRRRHQRHGRREQREGRYLGTATRAPVTTPRRAKRLR